MSTLAATASLLVAAADLSAVRGIVGAIRANEAADPTNRLVRPAAEVDIRSRPVHEPQPRIEPRRVIEPTPRIEPRQVHHPEPRLEATAANQYGPPVNPEHYVPRKEAVLPPPWRMKLEETAPIEVPKVKPVIQPPDIVRKGMLIDTFM